MFSFGLFFFLMELAYVACRYDIALTFQFMFYFWSVVYVDHLIALEINYEMNSYFIHIAFMNLIGEEKETH